MIKVGLAGGRGYVGEELLGLLAKMPEYEVVYVGSRGSAGKKVRDLYESLELDLAFQDLSEDSIRNCPADVWIIAQPNGRAQELVNVIASSDARMIDISSDYRFDDRWIYGLPERNAEQIKRSRQIANPGCYATATQLALLPILEQIVGTPVAFGISGYSGAGRTPSDKNNPDRLADNILPYSLTGHTHELEVSRHLQHSIRFMPHVASFFRGISVTVDVELDQESDPDQLMTRFADFYSDHPLVQVSQTIPEIQQVAETNQAIVGGFAIDDRNQKKIAIVSVIDNLRKGAASQAVQNLNLMFGLESERGLVE